MTIELNPDQQRVLDLAVSSGACGTAGDVVNWAFEIIRLQFDPEDWMVGQRDEIALHLEEGFAQAERGELIDGDLVVEMLRQGRSTSRG